MKVILRADVEGLGRKGDVCEVAAGHARNFLIPRGLALKSSAGGQRQAEAMRRNVALKRAVDRADAEEIAVRLAPTVVAVSARAAATGQPLWLGERGRHRGRRRGPDRSGSRQWGRHS